MRPPRSVVVTVLLSLVACVLATVGPASKAAQAAAPSGIRGVVTDSAGRPVPYARVAIGVHPSDGLGPTHVQTDSRGRFAVTLPAGNYSMNASPPTYPAGSPFVATPVRVVAVLPGQWLRVDPVLPVAATIRVRVVDLERRPLAGVGVRLALRQADGTFVDTVHAPVSAGDGRLEVAGLPPGRYRLTAATEGRLTTTWPAGFSIADGADVVLGDGSVRDLGDLVLLRPSTLRGQIVRPDDPAAWLAVDTLRIGDADRAVTTRQVDDAGRFSVTGLRPGRHVVWFDSDGVREFWRDADEVASATVVTIGPEQDLALGAPAVLRATRLLGRVVTTSGIPVRTSLVLRRRTGDTWVEAAHRPQTDEAGRYTAGPLVPGRYRIAVVEPSSGSEGRPVELDVARETDTRFDGRVRDLGVLRGRVTDAAGRAASDAAVQLFQQQSDGAWTHYPRCRPSCWSPHAVDADGAFAFSVPDGRYRLGVLPNGSGDPTVFASAAGTTDLVETATDLVVASEQTVRRDVRLPRPGSVSGTVTDPSGVPLAGATVHLLTAGRQLAPPLTRTGDDGRYTLDQVYPGSYVVQAGSTGRVSEAFPDTPLDGSKHPPGAVPVVLAAGQHVTGRDFELARPSSVTLELDAGDPPAVDGVEMTLYRRVGDRWVARPDAEAQASSLRVGDLPAGRYRLGYLARLSDGTFADVGNGEAGVTPEPDGDDLALVERDVVLRESVTTSGTVSGTVSRASSGTVVVERSTGADWQVIARRALHDTAASTAAYATPRLAPGRYRLTFAAPARITTTVVVDVGQKAVRRDVTMPGVQITGRQFGSRSVLVSAVRPDGSVAGTVVTPGGDFAVGGLPPGRYALHLRDLTGQSAAGFVGSRGLEGALAAADFVTADDDTSVYIYGGLRPGRVVQGRAVRSGSPGGWHRVELLAWRGGRWMVAATDSSLVDGHWRMVGVGTGTYRLRYSAFGLGRSPDVQVDGGCAPSPGRVVRVAGGPADVVDVGTRVILASPEYGTAVARPPVVSGQARVGRRLRVSAGTWRPCEVRLRYQWHRDGVAVRGRSGPSYAVTRADLGARLSVQVTAAPVGPSARDRDALTVSTRSTPRVRARARR